ncbi:MAG: hypothetical protein GY801_12755, partial [bacterium]|nr:hypothetical protein [bacterium]
MIQTNEELEIAGEIMQRLHAEANTPPEKARIYQMHVRQYVISGTHEEARPGRNLVRVTGCLLRSLLVAMALLPCNLQAQSSSSFDEVGSFYMQNFSPEDYDAHAQNWDIAQSPEGLLYVANGSGMLEYDGVSWRLIPISNNSSPRSLAI